jgi:hypothetical protein
MRSLTVDLFIKNEDKALIDLIIELLSEGLRNIHDRPFGPRASRDPGLKAAPVRPTMSERRSK